METLKEREGTNDGSVMLLQQSAEGMGRAGLSFLSLNGARERQRKVSFAPRSRTTSIVPISDFLSLVQRHLSYPPSRVLTPSAAISRGNRPAWISSRRESKWQDKQRNRAMSALLLSVWQLDSQFQFRRHTRAKVL